MLCSYFSAQPSACASYSIARTTCPVACGTCSPPPPGPSDLMVLAGAVTSHPVAMAHAVQSHLPMPLARPSPPPRSPLTELGRALPSSQHDGRQLAPSTTIVGSGSIVGSVASASLVPSHRRELQTQVSTVSSLTNALANTAVVHIVLASGTYYLSVELSITRSVILQATPGATVVLHAQASSSSRRRVLKIDLGSSDVVQLIGLSITGGYADEDGGGVRVSGGTVTMSSCTISGNTAGGSAKGSDRRGGGVCVWSGAVTFSSCTITGNTGSDGGGVYVRGGTQRRRYLCLWRDRHSGNLIVHHQREHSYRCIWGFWGRRCLCLWWHSGHLVLHHVHHEREHRKPWEQCLCLCLGPVGSHRLLLANDPHRRLWLSLNLPGATAAAIPS